MAGDVVRTSVPARSTSVVVVVEEVHHGPGDGCSESLSSSAVEALLSGDIYQDGIHQSALDRPVRLDVVAIGVVRVVARFRDTGRRHGTVPLRVEVVAEAVRATASN